MDANKQVHDSKDAGSQTEPYSINILNCANLGTQTLSKTAIENGSFWPSQYTNMDVESLILKRIKAKQSSSNETAVIDDGCKHLSADTASFFISNGLLGCRVSKNYATLLEKSKSDVSLEYYVGEIQKAFSEIIQNRHTYFDSANKLHYKEPLSLPLIFALFAIWLSEAVQDEVGGFVVDFIVLLYLRINKKRGTEDESDYFINNYILSSTFPDIEDAKELAQKLLDKELVFHIDCYEIIGYLVDYFKGDCIDGASELEHTSQTSS